MFHHANHNVFNNPTLIVNEGPKRSLERPGLDKLLNNSMRDTFHDSAARWPPPRCHGGTRKDLIQTITDWGTGASEHVEPVLWMHGPFGVGKSALSQTCTEAFAANDKLAASIFFSLPNKRNNPDRVFTSISYQISLNCPELGDLVDDIILRNPTFTTASRRVQFDELIVKPLHRIGAQGVGMNGWVVVLDGFDECEGRDEQCEILDIVIASIRNRTTPFRWFIVSRPETHINSFMDDQRISPMLFSLDIPLSPETDDDIWSYLVSELKAIGERYRLSPSWPDNADITALIKIIGGLWVAAATIVRFVGDRNVSAPIAQLHRVLSFGETTRGMSLSDNPWAQMDLLYHFVLEQCSPTTISRVRRILLLNRAYGPPHVNEADEITYALGLHRDEFDATCGFLQSVLYLRGATDGEYGGPGLVIQFYHASFMEFMTDETRSKDFYILSDFLDGLRREIIDRMNDVHDQVRFSRSGGTKSIDLSHTFPTLDRDNLLAYNSLVQSLMRLIDLPGRPLSISVAESLQNVDFSTMRCLLRDSPFNDIPLFVHDLKQNIPPNFHNKLIRRTWNPLHYLRQPRHSRFKKLYILGHGKSKIICATQSNVLFPNSRPPAHFSTPIWGDPLVATFIKGAASQIKRTE